MLDFYKGKKVLITGHTGFKGSWMCKVLVSCGADVYGYALEPSGTPNLFDLCGLRDEVHSVIGDVRDLNYLKKVFAEVQPEIVIHMAAQPLVRESYKNPVYTYDVNVMGTVNVLECIRLTTSVRSFVNVTTDKVYLNREWSWGYRENEELNGYDPYSNSKSCSELVTSSYYNSFFRESDIAISTMRAGNVIGGGDYAADRIIPDCVRAALSGQEIIVRNPYSVRPYQHVLEPVFAYLMVAKAQYNDRSFAGNYNIGPDDCDCRTTGELVDLFCNTWNRMKECKNNDLLRWLNRYDGGPHEAAFLKLDCSKIKSVFGWCPVWRLETAVEKVVEWNLENITQSDIVRCMDRQIQEFVAQSIWL